MTHNIRLATLILLGTLPLAGITAEPSPGASSPPSASKPSETAAIQTPDDFKRLDKDKDGMISKDEAKTDKKLSGQFDKVDADHDGKIALSEWKAFKSAGAAGATGESHMKSPSGKATTGKEPAAPASPQSNY